MSSLNLQMYYTTEMKGTFFRYMYALYYEHGSRRDNTLSECFQEDFEIFFLQDFSDIDALHDISNCSFPQEI